MKKVAFTLLFLVVLICCSVSLADSTVTANCYVGGFGNMVDSFDITSDVDLSNVQLSQIKLSDGYVNPYAMIEGTGAIEVFYSDGILHVDVDDFVIYRSPDFVLNVEGLEGNVLLSIGYGDVTFSNPDVAAFSEEQTSGTLAIPYRLYAPDSDEVLPLILYLHGHGQEGNDNLIQMLSDNAAVALSASVPQAIQTCYVMVPQCPLSGDDSFGWGDTTIDAIISEIQMLVDAGKVDANRIYLMGHSMGGQGVFLTLARYPETFAAAVEFAGAISFSDEVDINIAEKVATSNTPIWMIHAEDDFIVDIQYAVNTYNALVALNANVHMTATPSELGYNHGVNSILATDYSLEDDTSLYQWLFEQVLQ